MKTQVQYSLILAMAKTILLSMEWHGSNNTGFNWLEQRSVAFQYDSTKDRFPSHGGLLLR